MKKNSFFLSAAKCLTFILFLLLVPAISYSSQLIHTIQAGSFLTVDDARKQFDSLAEKLSEAHLENLRIEKVGKFYSVRLGKFMKFTDADSFLGARKTELSGAAIMKAYIKEERIIKAHTVYSSVDRQQDKEGSVTQPEPAKDKPRVIKAVYKNDNDLPLREKLSRASLFDSHDDNAPLIDEPAGELINDGVAAVTMPSADMTLSFIQPGRIAKVGTQEGDLVKADQVLVQQDFEAEQVQLSLIKKRSEDTTQIQAKKASLAQKRVYLEKLKWAAERGSATELELEDAKLAVKIAGLDLKTAEFEHAQSIRKYQEAKIRMDHMSLKSPITGRVEKVEVEVGESIDGLTSAVRVVQIDPLWIDVHVPLEKGKTLSLDQTAQINFPGPEQNVMKGKIIFISTVADAASSTLRARIEVPNKANRTAGEHVNVLFSKP